MKAAWEDSRAAPLYFLKKDGGFISLLGMALGFPARCCGKTPSSQLLLPSCLEGSHPRSPSSCFPREQGELLFSICMIVARVTWHCAGCATGGVPLGNSEWALHLLPCWQGSLLFIHSLTYM